MKFYSKKIETVTDVAELIKFIVSEKGLDLKSFDPEASFSDYITHVKLPNLEASITDSVFTPLQAAYWDGLLQSAKTICKASGADINEITLAVIRPRNREITLEEKAGLFAALHGYPCSGDTLEIASIISKAYQQGYKSGYMKRHKEENHTNKI
jgi:hypothetical protein